MRGIIIVIIIAGIFLTACGGGGGEETEQESQVKAQPELHTEIQTETQSEIQDDAQSKPENDSDNWAQAYLSLIAEMQDDGTSDEMNYSLIYINDDDIPELVFNWKDGSAVSVCTWQDGQVYTVMDSWTFGTWGRVYAYVPFQNIVGTVCYSFGDTDYGYWNGDYWDFYQMSESCELEYVYRVSRICNYVGDNFENKTVRYYYEEDDMAEPREITEEEFNTYGVTGEREFYYEDAEKYIFLYGHSSPFEIINALKLDRAQLTNDEITLSDITWDDYNSGNEYETWLHFSFIDGTVVDKELPHCPSMVKKVDYIDITGDGKDEVLIYRYFANTATEYTLVNFFQIEENTVTEISPELKLEDLADNVWSVIDEDFSEKEYDMPVFTMESYSKENMMTYADKRLLVGYQDGGWQIIEEQIHDFKSDD